MTTSEGTVRSLAEDRIDAGDIGLDEWQEVVAALRSYRLDAEDIGANVGMRGLNYLIAQVLRERYPADVFAANIVQPIWLDEHGGTSFDPGLKWLALLRAALEEVP